MKKRLLIVTYYWPPSGGPGVQRHLKFAKYLPRFDVRPYVLTVSNPTYPIRDESLLTEVPAGLKVYRSKTVEPFRFYESLRGRERIKPTTELEGNSLGSSLAGWIRANIFIPDARAGWLPTAWRKANEVIRRENIDTVITTGPPHSVHFVGKFLQQKRGLRWLADFRDPWSRIYYNQLLPRTAVAEQIDERLEKMVLAQADEVIVVSRSQAENFRKLFERGYRVITNGFDHEDFDSLESGPSGEERFILRHVGNIGEGAVPKTLLETIGREENRDRFLLEFTGDVHPQLPRLVTEMGLSEQVRFRDYLPHREALRLMCRSDALLLCIPDVEGIEHHIPGKLFEYLATGRPILLLGPSDGESAAILREEEAGITVPFGNADGMHSALQRLIGGDPPARPLQSRVDHPFSRHELTRHLAELILHPGLIPSRVPNP